MIFYTKDEKRVSYNTDNCMSTGTQGSIFKLNPDTCMKVYHEDSKNKSIFDDIGVRFNQETFDYFKDNFSNTNMCKLYDLLYDEKTKTVIAYTMKLYKETIQNILNMPISYILDNFSLIYDIVMKLTDECIRVVDLHSKNILITDNIMVIIDYDKYNLDLSSTKETLEFINKSALIYAFNDIFKNELLKIGIDIGKDESIKNKLSYLFTMNTTPLVLKCKLRGYSRAIDYFRK